MQGIIKYVQRQTGNSVKYLISTDIEKDRVEFEKRKQNADDNRRLRYIKRLDFEIAEITDEKAPEQLSDTQREQLKAREGKRILERLTDGEYLIATAIDGQSLSSEQLARRIDALMTEGKSSTTYWV